MRLRGRVDNNQPEIVKFLRKMGVSVLSLAPMGDGCPDLLVGINGKNYLFEIKKTKKSKLTKSEKIFQTNWKGQVQVVCNPESIFYLINKKIKGG